MKPLVSFYNSFFLFLCFLLCSCTFKEADNIECEDKPVFKQNISSEMALFMRELTKSCDSNKLRLKNKQLISFDIDEQRILTSEMTKGHHKDSAYKSYASKLIEQIDEINNNSLPDKQLFFYNAMIQNCISCHQGRCPGPIKKIKKLKLN